MNAQINQWALRYGVSYQALHELQAIFGTMPTCNATFEGDTPPSEAFVQSLVRLEASRKGLKLWRNNVGVLRNERGDTVRYGLANDSPALNKRIKSADLIGWRPIRITVAHLNTTIGQFVSRECKQPNWKYTGTEHEAAQLKWIEAILADGGDAKFCNGEGSL